MENIWIMTKISIYQIILTAFTPNQSWKCFRRN